MTIQPNTPCRWCGMIHGPSCFMVKAIEFHEDGITVKRVEFKGATDYPQQATSVPTVFQIPDAPANTR